MMTTAQIAAAFGVPTSTILRVVKKSGMRWELKKGMGYEFNDDQVDRIAAILVQQRRTDPMVRVFVRERLRRRASARS